MMRQNRHFSARTFLFVVGGISPDIINLDLTVDESTLRVNDVFDRVDITQRI